MLDVGCSIGELTGELIARRGTDAISAMLNIQRDALALQMNGLLEQAEFGGQPIAAQLAQALVAQGQALLDRANSLLS